jgi:hypothetical protein
MVCCSRAKAAGEESFVDGLSPPIDVPVPALVPPAGVPPDGVLELPHPARAMAPPHSNRARWRLVGIFAFS